MPGIIRYATWVAALAAVLLLDGARWPPTPAAAKTCGSREVEKATKALGNVADWRQLHGFYAEFANCNDGGPADDITERVVRLLVDRWDDLKQLSAESKAGDGFQKFVVSHIDSTADTDDLGKIRKLASKNCPSDLTALCRQIGDAARKATK